MQLRKPIILYITPVLQHPPAGGPALRIENSIKALAQIAELHLYSRVTLKDMGGNAALAFFRRQCHSVHMGTRIDPISRSSAWLRRGINKIARHTIGREVLQAEDFGRILQTAKAVRADVIWLGYGNISYPLLRYIKEHSSYLVVVDTDSVWSRYLLRGLPYASSSEERQSIQASGIAKEEEERWGTQLADVTTAVSEPDADYYRGLAPDTSRVHLFSNVIDLDTYANVPNPTPVLRRPCIYLAGTFWPGSPMEHAARWVIEQVLPHVRQAQPNLHLYIVGKNSNLVLKDITDPKITVTGALPSVLPYLCYTDVALVPLWFESGTRFKILEAGACGIPVVSTMLGAEGITVRHGHNILIADTPEGFATEILTILSDRQLAKRLGSNLKELVAAHYSLSALMVEGQHILDYVADLKRQRNT